MSLGERRQHRSCIHCGHILNFMFGALLFDFRIPTFTNAYSLDLNVGINSSSHSVLEILLLAQTLQLVRNAGGFQVERVFGHQDRSSFLHAKLVLRPLRPNQEACQAERLDNT